MRLKAFVIFLFIFSAYLHLNSTVGLDIDASELCDLEGYTIIECTSAEGDVEGDYGELVKLYNGMIFELEDSHYTYSYDPDVVIFAKLFKPEGKEYIFYKLVIDDEIYDASRIR